MENPFLNNSYKKELTKINKKKYLILIIIIFTLVLIGIASYLIIRINIYKAPSNLNLEYMLASGYKINYNSNWTPAVDNTKEVIFTNSDGVSVTISSALVNNQNLNQIIQSRLDLLKNKNIDISTKDTSFNNITFKEILLKNKTDENIVKPDTIDSYATLNGNVYTLITMIVPYNKNSDEALSIIKTFRNS